MLRRICKTLCGVSTLSALCLVTASQAQNILAGPIVNPSNNHTYYMLDNASWTDSESKAITLGGHLTTINSNDENDWVFDTFVPLLPTGNNATLWIGLNDAAQEGTFVWANGEPVTYTNWVTGQPDNAHGGQDYAYITTPGIAPVSPQYWRMWDDTANDRTSGGTLYGVVEVVSVSQVPEPDTLALLTGIVVPGIAFLWRRHKKAV